MDSSLCLEKGGDVSISPLANADFWWFDLGSKTKLNVVNMDSSLYFEKGKAKWRFFRKSNFECTIKLYVLCN